MLRVQETGVTNTRRQTLQNFVESGKAFGMQGYITSLAATNGFVFADFAAPPRLVTYEQMSSVTGFKSF